jgi:hypothetical protein
MVTQYMMICQETFFRATKCRDVIWIFRGSLSCSPVTRPLGTANLRLMRLKAEQFDGITSKNILDYFSSGGSQSASPDISRIASELLRENTFSAACCQGSQM